MQGTGKRELFAREYLKDLNATQAAIRAGYSAKNANDEGFRLLADVKVRSLMEELAAERNRKLEIEAQDVLLELRRMLNSDIALLYDEDGALKNI